jgi:hypothetical protein
MKKLDGKSHFLRRINANVRKTKAHAKLSLRSYEDKQNVHQTKAQPGRETDIYTHGFYEGCTFAYSEIQTAAHRKLLHMKQKFENKSLTIEDFEV